MVYEFEADRTIIEENKPMSDDELREDMIKDGWTTEQIEGFFAMYS
jgi:hypothetical protein